MIVNETIRLVWEKARLIPGQDPNKLRMDECGALIIFNQYGNRNSHYGWEIDHIKPIANGGRDHISNLRLLQWKNNLDKTDGRLTCPIRAAYTY